MKTKNSYNAKYNTLWHDVGWGWKLVGRKDQMNRNQNQKKEGDLVFVLLCFNYSTIYIYDLVPKGVHENRTKGVENKVDDTLKLVVFLECAQC